MNKNKISNYKYKQIMTVMNIEIQNSFYIKYQMKLASIVSRGRNPIIILHYYYIYFFVYNFELFFEHQKIKYPIMLIAIKIKF